MYSAIHFVVSLLLILAMTGITPAVAAPTAIDATIQSNSPNNLTDTDLSAGHLDSLSVEPWYFECTDNKNINYLAS